MKAKRLGILAFAGLLSSCTNQEVSSGKVPSVALNAVSRQYPAKEAVEWKQLGNRYEAEINLTDSTDLTVQVDGSGKIVAQKQDMAVALLPEAIRSAIQAQYADYTIDDVERVERDGVLYYQLELEASGRKAKNLVFSADGKEAPNTAYWD